MKQEQKQLRVDWEDVETFYNLLHPEKDTLVYQCFYKTGGATGQKYIENLSEVKRHVQRNKGEGLNCLSINPREEGETGEDSVTKLRTIFVDIDVKDHHKEDGVAPQEYKDKAREASKEVSKYLQEEHNLQYEIVADSGNGYHLYIPVDFTPSFSWDKTPIKESLEQLNKDLSQFDTDHIEVDSITKDVARRVKIPGTNNVKPDMEEDTEIRQASIETHKEDVDREENTRSLKNLEVDIQEEEDSSTTSSSTDKQETVTNPQATGDIDKLEKARKIDDKLDDLMRGSDIKNDRSFSEYVLCQKAIYWGLNPEGCVREAGIGKYDEKDEEHQQDYISSQVEKAKAQVSDRFDWSEWQENPYEAKEDAEDDLEELETLAQEEKKRRESQGFYMPDKYMKKNDSGELVVDSEGDRIPKKSTTNNDYAREFAEWLAREKKEVVNVIYEVDKEKASEIWTYNQDTKTWTTGGGESHINTRLYQELPQKHRKSLKEETILKVKAISNVDYEETQTGENVLAVQNGLLDVKQEELRDIEKEDYIHKQINAAYKPEAGMPQNLIDFLNESARQEDVDKIQEYLGYSLLDTTKYKKMLMTVGPQNSGKSVLLKVVERLMGEENVASQKLEDLANDPYSRANLLGTKVNIRNDLDGNVVRRPGTIKELASGDTMDREVKFQQKTQFKPSQKHWYACNETPSVSEDNDQDSFYDKFLTVTFPKEVPKSERVDRDKLVDKLANEEERDKILNWALEGLERLEEQGEFTNQLSTYEVQEKWKQYGNSAEKFVSKYLVCRKTKYKEYMQQVKEEHTNEEGELNMREEEIEEIVEDKLDSHTWKIHTQTVERLYKKYTTGMGLEEKSTQKLVKQIKEKPGARKGKPKVRAKDSAKASQRNGFFNVKLIEEAHDKIEKAIDNKASITV